MSLQWNLVAGFLYVEMFLCVLFMLPFISPQRWKKLFNSRLFNSFRSYANLYFNIFIVILIILFIDSIRDVRKYSEPMGDDIDLKNNPSAEAVVHMKLFRAQRNFYIAGFALFLFLVLRKLVTMISKEAQLMADAEAAQAQARSASEAARRMLEDNGDNQTNEGEEAEELRQKLSDSKVKVMQLENEIEKGKSDMEAMKKQATAIDREYDRLAEEHVKVQKKLSQLEGEEGTKKDD